MKLSDTQSMILLAAAQHEAGLARAPKTLPAAARNAVFRALLKSNLITEINAPREHVGLAWRQDEDGTWVVASITDEGLRAIGIDPNEGDAAPDTAPTVAVAQEDVQQDALAAEAAQGAPVGAEAADAEEDPEAEDDDRPRHERLGISDDLIYGPPDEDNGGYGFSRMRTEDGAMLDQALANPTTPRASLRDAAQRVLKAWDASPAQDATDNPIFRAIEALRSALAGTPARAPRDPGAPRKPREGTKQEQVLATLSRPEGVTIAQIAEATAWAQHTVRGFFAGLKKHQGIEVKVLERIRQVGPNKQGAKGSYSIYGIASAAVEVG